MNEIWKPIKNFENLYEVSNLGNVKRLARVTIQNKKLNEKLLKLFNNGHGYIRVNLAKNGENFSRYIHRLVAESFIPNPENKKEVNHKDGNKSNNNLDNLEWVTPSENQKHAVMNGLHPPYPIKYGKNHPRSVPVLQFSLTGEFLGEFCSATEASNIIGVSRTGVLSNCKGYIKCSGNFIWKYKFS